MVATIPATMPTAQERRQIEVIVRDAGRLTERVVRGIALDLHGNLVEATPVDTGYARANWVPRVGRPQPRAVGTPGSGGVGAAQAAANGGVNQVLGYRLAQGRVHVTNNVPYIEALNAGHSPQAPAGFVQRSIRDAVRAVR